MSKLILDVVCGLSLFILGMKFMSDGLHIAAGDRMRSLLHLFSRNRYIAILTGTLVTAVIQSSSASTMMVIGFVNAGLLNLTQSIGIIFGANIGTTITAQIITLKVSAIVQPAIILGVILLFVQKSWIKGWGEAILGLGLLFFGMGSMSTALQGVARSEAFMNVFRLCDCAPLTNGLMPFWHTIGAITIGILVTCIVQSSSAVSGIVIAMASSGIINFYTGVALILGSNIGTTVTAQLAALTANRVAKQAALAHTMFNVIGVVIVFVTFWLPTGKAGVPLFFALVDSFTPGNPFAAIPENLPRHIANAHTLFNVFTTLMLIPIIPLLSKFCEKIIPIGSREVTYKYLDEHFLKTPAIALQQSVRTLKEMLGRSWEMIRIATLEHFAKNTLDEISFKKLEEMENGIDGCQKEITTYLTRLMEHELTTEQSRIIPILMHCTNDAERMADHTESIVTLTKRLNETGKQLSEVATTELNDVYTLLKEEADCVMALLNRFDPRIVKQASDNHAQIIALTQHYEANHIARLNSGSCTPQVGIVFIEMLGEMANVSGRLINIAERAGDITDSSQYINPHLPRPDATHSATP